MQILEMTKCRNEAPNKAADSIIVRGDDERSVT